MYFSFHAKNVTIIITNSKPGNKLRGALSPLSNLSNHYNTITSEVRDPDSSPSIEYQKIIDQKSPKQMYPYICMD